MVLRLDARAVREHYQMRALLEPVAMVEAMAAGGVGDVLDAALGRIEAARRSARIETAGGVAEIEADLHDRIMRAAPNARMRRAIRQSQLPLIATHGAFDRYRRWAEMETILDDHEAVLRALAAGRPAEASAALADHLRRGEATTLDYLADDPAAPPDILLPYLDPVDPARAARRA